MQPKSLKTLNDINITLYFVHNNTLCVSCMCKLHIPLVTMALRFSPTSHCRSNLQLAAKATQLLPPSTLEVPTMNFKVTLIAFCALLFVCSAEDLCSNGRKDYNEADIDCGQECFDLCDVTKSCGSDYDCVSGICVTGKCAAGKFEDRFLAASGPDGNSTTGSVSGANMNTASSSLGLAVALTAMALKL